MTIYLVLLQYTFDERPVYLTSNHQEAYDFIDNELWKQLPETLAYSRKEMADPVAAAIVMFENGMPTRLETAREYDVV